MSRKQTFVDEMMNEVILYGGIPLRRCDVFKLATKHCGAKAKMFGADYFAFRPPAVNAEPWTIEQFEEMEAKP